MYTVPSSTIVFVLIFNYDNEQNECVAFFVGNEIISYNFQQQQLFPPLLTIFASKKIFIWNRKWFQVKTILVKRKIIFLRLKKNKTNFRIYGYDNVMLTVNIKHLFNGNFITGNVSTYWKKLIFHGIYFDV